MSSSITRSVFLLVSLCLLLSGALGQNSATCQTFSDTACATLAGSGSSSFSNVSSLGGATISQTPCFSLSNGGTLVSAKVSCTCSGGQCVYFAQAFPAAQCAGSPGASGTGASGVCSTTGQSGSIKATCNAAFNMHTASVALMFVLAALVSMVL